MRAVVQRVTRASVTVDGQVTGEIGRGLCVLLGVGAGDLDDDAAWMADKLLALRIFEDPAGKMNLSVEDAGGGLLVISQFTLFGDVRKGNRPGFSDAAPPAAAKALYERVVALLRESGLAVGAGVFQADMKVELVNDGPVTILLDSKKLF